MRCDSNGGEVREEQSANYLTFDISAKDPHSAFIWSVCKALRPGHNMIETSTEPNAVDEGT